MLFSCVVPKKYQPGKPFVFDVRIRVDGNQKVSEKKDLGARLSNQLDDSLRIQFVSFGGIYKRLISPPAYDTTNVRRSVGFMVALLNSLGYFSATIKDTASIRNLHFSRHRISHYHIVKDVFNESRVSIDFRVRPGKQLKFDSIGFNLKTPALEALALQSKPLSLLKKGDPYSKQIISEELDRLVELFRNNGYYKFDKSDLVAVRDTVVAALIDPTLDPFRQAALLEELKRKKEHPTVNVVIEQQPVLDSSRIMQYYIGHVTIYPDLPLLEDTVSSISTIDTSTTKDFTIISRYDKFKHAFLTNNVYLRPGSLYKLNNFTRTVNRFNQLGAWQQATPSLTLSDSSDSVLDLSLRLYPSKKMSLNQGLEVSRNTNDIVTASNLFGVGLNLGFRNLNTFKESVLSSTNLRGGVELGSDFIQTTQVSLSHSIIFPKDIPTIPKSIIRLLGIRRDSIRTILNLSAAYTDLLQLFTLRSVNASWGYEWTKGNRTFSYRPLNVEYTQLDKTDSFQVYLNANPSLNLAFKSGLVIGQQFVYSSFKKKGIHTNFLRISAEESGAISGLIRSWDEGPLWRYVTGDVEFRRHIDYARTELALRAYAGLGYAYGREGGGFEQTLPFYKAFFAGGPNSMRAWQVRQLGLGSSNFYDTGTASKLLDRFGDVKLEGNIEYRFPIGTFFGIKLKSAIFMDAGNIWDRDTTTNGAGSDFKFDRFYKEIAVDAGTGLRLDFDYFVLRFDYAYRIRDPQSLYFPNRWFYGLQLFNGQFQLGINYPF